MRSWTNKLSSIKSKFLTSDSARRTRSTEHRATLQMEMLEIRELLNAQVMTDLFDYAPGQTAIITAFNNSDPGTDFNVGESVTFQVTRSDGVPEYSNGNLPWTVTDGGAGDADGAANGSISTLWFVEEQYLGASLQLTAAGQDSGAVATTEFTDSAQFTSSITPTTVSYGSSLAFTLIVTNQNSGATTVRIGSFTVAKPAGFTVSGTPTIVAYDSPGTSSPQTWIYDAVGSTPTTWAFMASASFQTIDNLGRAEISFPASMLTATGFGSQAFTVSAFNGLAYDGVAFANSGSQAAVDIIAATITPAFTASNKTYNSLNLASVVFTGFSPSVGTNIVTVAYTSATFSDANAGLGKTVTIAGLSLGGADAFKYTLASSSVTTTADIFPKGITGDFTAFNKTYNGNNLATVLSRSLIGLESVDIGNVIMIGGTATFSDSNAGVGKIVTLTGATLSGTGSGNYSLTSVDTAISSIFSANATVIINGYSVQYDGNSHGLSGTASGASIDGSLSGFITYGAGVTNVPGGSIGWTFNAGPNYNLASGSATITITPATALINVDGYSAVYDTGLHGATGTASGVGGADLSGFLNFGASFTNAPGGTAHWTFDAGSNYSIAEGDVAIDIAKATLSFTADNFDKEFGELNPTFTVFIAGIVDGEDLETSGVTGSVSLTTSATQFSPSGTYTITASLGSLAAMNYTFTFFNGTLTVLPGSTGFVTIDGDGNLVVTGTNGDDSGSGGIVINSSSTGAVSVFINGSSAGSFYVNPATQRVIVYSLDGDDSIAMNGPIILEAHGGNGNDDISGGSGNDVLSGDNGNDTVSGANGNDVIVGGDGADRLMGSTGNDILIAGDFVGATYADFRALMDAWIAEVGNGDSTNLDTADAIADSVDVTSSNDNDVDKLTGSSGADLFIVSLSDKITDARLKALIDGVTNSDGDVVEIIA